MLTDTHCHLTKEFFQDMDEIIETAKMSGVGRYISAADSIASSKEMILLGEKYKDVYITLGIHPENCFDSLNDITNIIEENKNNSKFVAIGEIGLDYYYGKENKLRQIEVFEYQLALAEKYNLPVIVHSREATLDTINSIKKYNVKGVMHCYSGSLETAKELIKMGFYIGVGGVMTFKNSKIDEVIRDIPLNKIVLETDSPFLTPEPYRKYSNEPKYIKTIAEYLANLKHIDISEVEKTTENNVKEIFSI